MMHIQLLSNIHKIIIIINPLWIAVVNKNANIISTYLIHIYLLAHKIWLVSHQELMWVCMLSPIFLPPGRSHGAVAVTNTEIITIGYFFLLSSSLYIA